MLNVLLFGRTGQVATELVRRAPADIAVTALDRARVDLGDAGAAAALVRTARADIVVNAAAFTSVDHAEARRRTAMQVNAIAPGAIAAACAARGIPFIHISTDYVFDGSGTRPLTEDDRASPVNVYGRSKLDGERAVAAAGGNWLVLRTGWVFSSHGRNFVRSMLRLASERDWISVVDDQKGCPTAAADIAATILRLARRMVRGDGTGGVFHYCGMPATSWFGFARTILENRPVRGRPEILPIRTDEWPTAARRPLYTVLDCNRIREIHGIAQPNWIDALGQVRDELARVLA